ncbi:MAG: hypothetical protein A2Z72_02960 [Omnitrophica bacterium RBG_13_46_9]|nr:MAG: hypothetical protein A2Z72_02960 [Omnitrophica bacterium RBG_13_46_9]
MVKSKNIFVLFGTIGILFLAGELVANLVDALTLRAIGISAVRTDMDYRGLRPDPVLNRVHIPGLKFAYVVRDKENIVNKVEYNSKGLNDYEYGYGKPEGVSRIVVLGDSFVEALQVRREENFCKLIESKLNQGGHGKKYEVINMGVSGYSPILEYIYLKTEGLKYDPDIVISCFFMNDVYEDSVYREMAVFGDDNLPVSVHWKGLDKTDKLKGWKRVERKFFNSVKNIANKSKFYIFLKQRLYKLLMILKVKKMSQEQNPFFILNTLPQAEEDALWYDTLRYILAAKALSETSRAKFLLIVVPIESQLSDSPQDTVFMTYFREKPCSERVRSRLSRLTATYGINYVDLLQEFGKMPREDLYFDGDGHFNANGHRQVADLISGKLRVLGWVD